MSSTQLRICVWITILSLYIGVPIAEASYAPLSVANNRFGVHILHREELDRAAELVNSSGGDWGYVVIPIRTDEMVLSEWQKFMDQAQKLHLIPILRLATYGQKESWTKPTLFDPVDWANFLSNLTWPTKNHYVIIGNETNHSYEWQNRVEPAAYAKYLKKTIKVLKNKDTDFFVLPAAMDVATPDNHISLSAYAYWQGMHAAEPEVFTLIDGWNSHAYPNPGFAGHPLENHQQSIVSYRHELKFAVTSLGVPANIPVFVTETGWSKISLAPTQIAKYYQTAYSQVWLDANLVTVAPFVLNAQTPPFNQFSLLDHNQAEGIIYNTIKAMPKNSGSPQLSTANIRGVTTHQSSPPKQVVDTSKISAPILGLNPYAKLVHWLKNFTSLFNLKPSQTNNITIMINQKPVELEVVKGIPDITRGLSYRPSLPQNQGMLFIMPVSMRHVFWMKGMQFPLDFVWLDANLKIVDLSANVQPSGGRFLPIPTIIPKQSAKYVLEFNAGFINANQLKIGGSFNQLRQYL